MSRRPGSGPPLRWIRGSDALARVLLLAAWALAGCAPVPPPPADLLEVVDLGDGPPVRGARAARELLAEADSAWERREEPGQAALALRDYGRAAAADPSSYDAYWKAARASGTVGQRLEKETSRAAEFERGAGIARLGIAVQPERAEAHYYSAVTLGLWARERESIGVAAVKEMIPHLETAGEADPGLERGGPFRTLALVYLRAPGWPTSVGDEAAGLDWARRAADQDPEHPGNQLALAEALQANGEGEAAREAAARAVDLARAGAWTERERAEFLDDAARIQRRRR